MVTTRIIGIGHMDRGDDAVGRLAAAQLKSHVPAGVEVIETDGEAGKLLDLFQGVDTIIVIDACASGAKPGTVQRIDAVATAMPRWLGSASSHAIGLAESVELARALGQLPERLVVYAVEAQTFTLGAPLSAPVAKALDALPAQILGDLSGAALFGKES
jgi:hydrogenase maturation protease